MKVPESVIKRATDVFVQSMADPPPVCPGADLHLVAMQAALEQVSDDIRAAVRISLAEPHAPGLGESMSIVELERLMFTTLPGKLLRMGVPFLTVPLEAPYFDKVVAVVKDAAGDDLQPEFVEWLNRVQLMRDKTREVAH